MGSDFIPRREVQALLGVSERTMGRRISALRTSHPEMVQSRKGGHSSRETFVAREALEQGLLGKVPEAGIDPVLHDQLAMTQAAADAFEADNDRLRLELRATELEGAVLALSQENSQLKQEVERLRSAVMSLVAADFR